MDFGLWVMDYDKRTSGARLVVSTSPGKVGSSGPLFELEDDVVKIAAAH